MTKERYLEMCEMLGNQPLEEEIPVEEGDLTYQSIKALEIYKFLRDVYDSNIGRYLGKDLSNISSIFDIFGVDEDRKLMYQLIVYIDMVHSKEINRKISSKPKSPPA